MTELKDREVEVEGEGERFIQSVKRTLEYIYPEKIGNIANNEGVNINHKNIF